MKLTQDEAIWFKNMVEKWATTYISDGAPKVTKENQERFLSGKFREITGFNQLVTDIASNFKIDWFEAEALVLSGFGR